MAWVRFGATACQTVEVTRADRRERKGYPPSWEVPVVAPDGWMSQQDAAESLGVSMARVAWLIQAHVLVPVRTEDGKAGVSTASVAVLAQRRADTGLLGRARMLGGQVVRSVTRAL